MLERPALDPKFRFIGGKSLFAEAGGINTPGSAIEPLRQISEEQTRLRILLTPPGTIQPGASNYTSRRNMTATVEGSSIGRMS